MTPEVLKSYKLDDKNMACNVNKTSKMQITDPNPQYIYNCAASL